MVMPNQYWGKKKFITFITINVEMHDTCMMYLYIPKDPLDPISVYRLYVILLLKYIYYNKGICVPSMEKTFPI